MFGEARVLRLPRTLSVYKAGVRRHVRPHTARRQRYRQAAARPASAVARRSRLCDRRRRCSTYSAPVCGSSKEAMACGGRACAVMAVLACAAAIAIGVGVKSGRVPG